MSNNHRVRKNTVEERAYQKMLKTSSRCDDTSSTKNPNLIASDEPLDEEHLKSGVALKKQPLKKIWKKISDNGLTLTIVGVIVGALITVVIQFSTYIVNSIHTSEIDRVLLNEKIDNIEDDINKLSLYSNDVMDLSKQLSTVEQELNKTHFVDITEINSKLNLIEYRLMQLEKSENSKDI